MQFSKSTAWINDRIDAELVTIGENITETAALLSTAIATKMTFVDRGNFSGTDFYQGDFTRDETWYDLDLSDIIPAGAKAVLVCIKMGASATGAQVKFRTKGYADEGNMVHIIVAEANVNEYNEVWIIPDSDGIISYAIWPTSGLYLNLFIRGWLI